MDLAGIEQSVEKRKCLIIILLATSGNYAIISWRVEQNGKTAGKYRDYGK